MLYRVSIEIVTLQWVCRDVYRVTRQVLIWRHLETQRLAFRKVTSDRRALARIATHRILTIRGSQLASGLELLKI
jgi:hypothetical protein